MRKKQLRLWLLKQWHIFKSRFDKGTIGIEENALAGLYSQAFGLWQDKNPFQYDEISTRQAFLNDLEGFLEILRADPAINTSPELEGIIIACYLAFLDAEPTFIKEPHRPKDFYSSSLQKQEKDRSKLLGYIQHNENLAHYAPEWQQYIFGILMEIISRIDLPEGTSEPASILLQSELLQLSAKQGEIMRWCFSSMETEGAERDYFFRSVLWRLTNNFNTALGIRHHKAARLEFHEYFLEEPTSQRAQALLAGTPFETLLLSHLPLPVSDHYRFEHCQCVAGTGHGKTQLLQQMILNDLSRPADQIPSMVIIDSQGDMLENIKRLKLFERGNLSERLLIVDPTDIACPPQLNFFDFADQSDDPKIQEQDFGAMLEMFDFIFAGLLGAPLSPQQKVVFRNLAKLMRFIPDATIMTLKAVLAKPLDYLEYMQKADPVTRDFFIDDFLPAPNSKTGGAYGVTRKSISTRLQLLVDNPSFLRMFGAKRNRLDLYKALQEEGKIILVHTDKAFLQSEVSAMFGRYMIAAVFKAAMERARVDEAKRRPTFLYVDEAQEYFDSSIRNMLEQARKYRVGMVFAHQNLSQIDKELEGVIHGNTSIKIAGGLKHNDPKIMAKNMDTTEQYIMGMKVEKKVGSDFAIYVKNMTPRAMSYRVTFGAMESQPKISQQDYDRNVLRSQMAFGCGDEDDGGGGNKPEPDVPQPVTDEELEARFSDDKGEDEGYGYSQTIHPKM